MPPERARSASSRCANSWSPTWKPSSGSSKLSSSEGTERMTVPQGCARPASSASCGRPSSSSSPVGALEPVVAVELLGVEQDLGELVPLVPGPAQGEGHGRGGDQDAELVRDLDLDAGDPRLEEEDPDVVLEAPAPGGGQPVVVIVVVEQERPPGFGEGGGQQGAPTGRATSGAPLQPEGRGGRREAAPAAAPRAPWSIAPAAIATRTAAAPSRRASQRSWGWSARIRRARREGGRATRASTLAPRHHRDRRPPVEARHEAGPQRGHRRGPGGFGQHLVVGEERHHRASRSRSRARSPWRRSGRGAPRP